MLRFIGVEVGQLIATNTSNWRKTDEIIYRTPEIKQKIEHYKQKIKQLKL